MKHLFMELKKVVSFIKKTYRFTPLDYLKGCIYSEKEKNIWTRLTKAKYK